MQGAHGSVPGVSQRSSRFRLGYRKRTLFRRTCAQLLIKLFQFRFGCMVVAHDTLPTNRFPSAVLQLLPCVSISIQCFNTSSAVADSATLRFPHSFPCGTDVTGALTSCRITTNRFCRFLHALDYLNGFSLHHCIPKIETAGLTVFYRLASQECPDCTFQLCIFQTFPLAVELFHALSLPPPPPCTRIHTSIPPAI